MAARLEPVDGSAARRYASCAVGVSRALINGFLKELIVKPLSRSGVNKGRSAAKFRRSVQKTKHVNMAGPMRGGIRL